MKRQIFAIALALVMLISAIPVTDAYAQEQEAEQGHYHAGVKYEPWDGGSGKNALPTDGKCYYLTNDIIRNTNGSTVEIAEGCTQHLCLNGFTVTHRNPAKRLYNIKGAFFLEDCSAHSQNGEYVSGGITYGAATPSTRTFGNCFSIQRGGTMTLTDGQIYGFYSDLPASQDGVPVYVQGADATGKAAFNMQGGQIHSNNTKASGAAIRLGKAVADPASENFSKVHISGGKIWGNTSKTNGGAIAANSDELHITGGTITANSASCGGVYVAEDAKLTISGNVTISGNQGGNLYLADDVIMDLGVMTGGSVGICAEKTGRAISTRQETDQSGFFICDDSAYMVRYVDNCLYLSGTHTHGLDGNTGDMEWTRWEDRTQLPAKSGNYYLAENVHLAEAMMLPENVQVNLCLNGKTVTAANGKRVMAVAEDAILNITDCCEKCGTITGGSGSDGGAFYLFRGSQVALYNGKITENTADRHGGAIYLQSAEDAMEGAVFCLYGGQISSNTAQLGGAIYAGAASRLIVSDGRICDNTASVEAGGVYAHNDMGELLVQGKPVVKDNRISERKSNIYLEGNAIITVDALYRGAELFVSAQITERAITAAFADPEVAAYFYSDRSEKQVKTDGRYLYLNTLTQHIHCVCNRAQCDHVAQNWSAWQSGTSLPADTGWYCLTEDVVLSSQAVVSAGSEVHLCLNGHKITAPAGERLIQIKEAGKLVLTDCQGTGVLTGGDKSYGGAVCVLRGGVLDMYGGMICENTAGQSAEGLGGAIYLQAGDLTKNGGTFNMYSGVLADNAAYRGGAVFAEEAESAALPASVNIFGGTIRNNHAAKDGGGVYMGNTAALTLDSTTFLQNSAGNSGGGIYSSGGSLIKESVFTGNTSYKDGAGICYVGENVDIRQCSFTGNVAQNNGGAMYVSGNCQAAVTAGEIGDNQARNGGAIAVESSADLCVQQSVFANNQVTAYGGTIYVNDTDSPEDQRSVLTLEDCTITESKSGKSGGAVYANGGTVHMTGGQVSKSQNGCATEDKAYGGAFYLKNAVGKFSAVSICDNTSKSHGGAICTTQMCLLELNDGVQICNNRTDEANAGAIFLSGKTQSTVTGAVFADNYARCGGAVFVQTGAKLTVTDSVFQNNEAGRHGGAIYIKTAHTDGTVSTLIMQDTTVSNNRSEKVGGGIFCSGYLEITGSTVKDNEACENGAGLYLNKAVCVVENSRIEQNKAGRNGGGVYCYAGQLQFGTGAKILNNESLQGAGGGLYLTQNCEVKLSGGEVTGNKANSKGAGLFSKNAQIEIDGASFAENAAQSNGGAVYASKGTLTIADGNFHSNTSQRYGGGMYFNDADVTLTKATIADNYAKAGSGGVYAGKGTLTLEKDVRVSGNSTDVHGGGIYATEDCRLTISGAQIENNTADSGGGILIRDGVEAVLNDPVIYNNRACNGGGVCVLSNVKLTISGGKISGNTASIKQNNGKTEGGRGAGMYLYANARNQPVASAVQLYGTVLSNNVAERTGGGVYVGKQMQLFMDGCSVQNNAADAEGAGIFQNSKSGLSLRNTVITGNTGKASGSAIYAGGDLTLDGCTITQNKTTQGTAVYVLPARHDGYAYKNYTIKLGGNLRICNNEGKMKGDLYLGKGVVATDTEEGFGKQTYIKVQLHSGLLTDTICASYHYEGSDRVYIITYGDRSTKEPEKQYQEPAVLQETETHWQVRLFWLPGALIVIVCAILIWLLIRKWSDKKEKPEEKRGA